MNKPVLFSLILFFTGLGFINGFHNTLQQLFSAALGFVFIVMPLTIRLAGFIGRLAHHGNKKAAA